MLHSHLVTSTSVAQKSIVGLYLKNVCLKDATFWKKIIRLSFLFMLSSCVPLSAGMRSEVCDKPGLAVSLLLDPKAIDGKLDRAGSCISFCVVHLNSILS